MALSYKKSLALWLSLSALYILWCFVSPLWYYIETPVSFPGDESINSDVGWVLRDSCYNYALIYLPLLNFIKDEKLRMALATMFLTEGIRENTDFIWWNNQFFITPFIINGLFILAYIVFLWFTLKPTSETS